MNNLRYVNFTKVIFRPIERLKIIGSWFAERSANFYSMVSRKNNGSVSCLGVLSPLQYSAFFTLRQLRKKLEFHLITTSKNN